MNNNAGRPKILIVDDSELNREILASILEDNYDILEAENGAEALVMIKSMSVDLSLILLDIVMPVCDGFGVLEALSSTGLMNDIPVVMISSETAPAIVERAYNYGVVDFIFRPFDARIVMNRVRNTINLYRKQRRLSDLVTSQIYEKTRNSNMLISVLSHIVEFRNGESGMHVLHINTITEMLLKALCRRTNKYGLTPAEISTICTASSMHDIGKISIPGEILNKPGRLTSEEFAVMKTHTTIGSDMISSLRFNQSEPLIKYCYQICRWHHERYDGRGYPDGLAGEDIPIAAQIVSIADVYDALTSERVYKAAFSHEKAMSMIRGGECGTFNPLLLECLGDISEELKKRMEESSLDSHMDDNLVALTDEIAQNSDLSVSTRVMHRLTGTKQRYDFYMSTVNDILFNFAALDRTLEFSASGANILGLQKTIFSIDDRSSIPYLLDKEYFELLRSRILAASPERPDFDCDVEIAICGVPRNYRINGRVAFSEDKDPVIVSIYGCMHED